VNNVFRGREDARTGALTDGRIGHLATLQRCSRADGAIPRHIRADGAGFDALDVPDGSKQPKLHFAMFVPTAERFADAPRPGLARPRR
jgi:hypothetical protein